MGVCFWDKFSFSVLTEKLPISGSASWFQTGRWGKLHFLRKLRAKFYWLFLLFWLQARQSPGWRTRALSAIENESRPVHSQFWVEQHFPISQQCRAAAAGLELVGAEVGCSPEAVAAELPSAVPSGCSGIQLYYFISANVQRYWSSPDDHPCREQPFHFWRQ